MKNWANVVDFQKKPAILKAPQCTLKLTFLIENMQSGGTVGHFLTYPPIHFNKKDGKTGRKVESDDLICNI